MTDAIHVLLVDDEETFVLNMERILKKRGFHVSKAFDGLEAVRCFASGFRSDVVLLDVKMPGMDGLTALREIKRLHPETPVIMLTGHATLASGIEAIREGAYDYLMKPCDIETVVEKIREAWEAGNIRRQPVLWHRKKVGEIPLHPLERLSPAEPLQKALELMRRERGEEAVEELYVIDADDRVRGYVTKRILLDEAALSRGHRPLTWNELVENPEWLPSKAMEEIMQPVPDETNPDAGLDEAAGQMLLHKIRSMPVVQGGRGIGVIRMKDIFHYVDLQMK